MANPGRLGHRLRPSRSRSARHASFGKKIFTPNGPWCTRPAPWQTPPRTAIDAAQAGSSWLEPAPALPAQSGWPAPACRCESGRRAACGWSAVRLGDPPGPPMCCAMSTLLPRGIPVVTADSPLATSATSVCRCGGYVRALCDSCGEPGLRRWSPAPPVPAEDQQAQPDGYQAQGENQPRNENQQAGGRHGCLPRLSYPRFPCVLPGHRSVAYGG
jgi:hypothetical protein